MQQILIECMLGDNWEYFHPMQHISIERMLGDNGKWRHWLQLREHDERWAPGNFVKALCPSKQAEATRIEDSTAISQTLRQGRSLKTSTGCRM